MTKAAAKKKPREIRGWIVMDGDRVSCWDERVPIYWLRQPAKEDARNLTFGADVRRVTIVIEEPK